MPESLADKATALLRSHGMMRSAELRAAGVTPATLQRMATSAEILRLSRGLYQLADAPTDSQHDLAEAAKRVPKGVICLTSALAYHGLTDQHPRRVWMAIGLKDWSPTVERPALHIVRTSKNLLDEDVERHAIEGVEVKIFSITRSIVDAFRLRRSVGRNLAIEALRTALRQRRARLGEIAAMAERRGRLGQGAPLPRGDDRRCLNAQLTGFP